MRQNQLDAEKKVQQRNQVHYRRGGSRGAYEDTSPPCNRLGSRDQSQAISQVLVE